MGPKQFVSANGFLNKRILRSSWRIAVSLLLTAHVNIGFGQPSLGGVTPSIDSGIPATGAGLASPLAGTPSDPLTLANRGRQGLVIEPRLRIVETYTNNATFSKNDARSDFITETSPGIRISTNGGRVRGFFDYSLRSLIYSSETSPNTIQHVLSSFATIEAIDNWAFIDLTGNVSRQAISAFGTQTSDTSRQNSNSTQVSTYSVSPYVRGSAGSVANYELRFRRSGWNTDSSSLSNAVTSEWLGTLSQEYPSRRFGWLIQAFANSTDYDSGRNIDSDRVRGVLTYFASPQLRLFVSGGRESNNYLTLQSQQYSNSGFGFLWRPTERTRIEAERERRFFGSGHKIVFDHRAKSSSFRYSDIKDVSVNSAVGGVAASGSLFDLLFNQFSTIEPDPVRRAQLVNTFLQANGLDPNAALNNDFLSSAATLRRLQQLSLSLVQFKDTYTLFANRTETRRLDPLAVVIDDLSIADRIRQHGVGVIYSRRLTPTAILSILASWQRSAGSSSSQESTFQGYSITYSNQLAPKVALGVGLRRTIFDAPVSSYKELAIFGSLSLRF